MTTRATLFAIVVGFFAITGCGGPPKKKILADTPALPYIAPDIAEITGIEEPDADEPADEPAEEPAPAPAPAAAPAPAPAPPATPAKTPAKAPAKK